jgi:lipopolysaccharide/colanic/teichoic acid biosynthesis glycosyltransferase
MAATATDDAIYGYMPPEGTTRDASTVHASEGSVRAARTQASVKRAIDIAVSVIVLLMTIPIFLVVALAIVIESPGPIFYRAERVGHGGRLLRMFKFRKMLPDAGGLRLTTGDDPRLTRVGAILTRTKLDELPQFLNVLRGEMSLVGPRPEDPGFVARRIDEYGEILTVRPGITGLSQIAFAEESRILCSENPLEHYLERIFPQKVAIDRRYATRATLAMDLRILFWTSVTVFLRRPVAVHRGSGAMSLRRRKQEAVQVASIPAGWPSMSPNEAPAVTQAVAAPQSAG